MKHETLKNVKAHNVYKTALGIRVPSTSTILSVLAKPALIHWAWDLGMKQIDYRKYKDVLADIGTLAHLLVLNRELGDQEIDTTPYSEEQIAMATRSLEKFRNWRKEYTNDFETLLIEKPFVSETHGYGGTIDCLARVNNKMTLLDIKTSKAIYAEHAIQLAAYSMLLEEHKHTVEQAMILRLGRSEDEGFEVRIFGGGELKNHWLIFESCLKIYNLQKQI